MFKKSILFCVGMCVLFVGMFWLLNGSAKAAPAVPTADFGSGLDICPAPILPVELSTPTEITDCTRAGIQAALDGGGHITFACGPDPITIPIDQPLLTNGETTVLDGGHLVTLDAQAGNRILEKPFTENDHTITLQNIRLVNGRAPSGDGTGDHSGGALKIDHPGTRLHIINTTFENNATTDTAKEDNQGGAIFVPNAYELIVSGSEFRGNTAGSGGALGGIATGMVIANSRFVDNHAVDETEGGIVRGYGGVVHLDGVRNSYNPNGNRQFTVCGSEFAQNSAVRGGGALSSVMSDGYDTKVTVSHSTFISNSVAGPDGTSGQGGAFYHIEDDDVGAWEEDNFEIDSTTFVGNTSGRQGGGLWLLIRGQGRIVNSTFAHNRTTAGFNEVGQGGGMAFNRGRITIENSTFAFNHADFQGGAMMAGGANDDRRITLHNTVFVGNTLNIGQTEPAETRWQGFHTNRRLTDGGQNMQFPQNKPTYDNDVNNWITDDPIFADPQVQPLGDNGGATETLALTAGSPAVDAGTNCPGRDQRGAPRSGACDLGAYERVGLVADKQVLDLNGTLDLSTAVAYQLRLTNWETAVVPDITITDDLPDGLTFGGWVRQAGATEAADVVSWGPRELAFGSSARVVFTATISAPADTELVNVMDYTTAVDSGSAEAAFTVGQSAAGPALYLPFVSR